VNNAQYNPLERLNATYKKQTRLQQNYNVGLNWKPIKGLTFRSEFGYGWRYNNTDQVWGVELQVILNMVIMDSHKLC
jgi:hypothetical protein